MAVHRGGNHRWVHRRRVLGGRQIPAKETVSPAQVIVVTFIAIFLIGLTVALLITKGAE